MQFLLQNWPLYWGYLLQYGVRPEADLNTDWHLGPQPLGRCFYIRVRNLKFATYLKFATCENTNKINELW